MAATRGAKERQPTAAENQQLRARLEEAEETLRAIRSGEVDALVVSTPDGERLFTLQGADQSYRALVERMNEGALTLSNDGMIIYANQRFAAMLKAPLERVIGSQLEQWIATESVRTLRAALETGMHQQCRETMDLAAADGSTLPVYLSLNRVSLDGVRDTLCVVATDLTEQKRAEEMIRLSEAQFRNVFENSLLGKRLIGMDGRQTVNKAFCEITGYTEEEAQAKGWEDITYPEDVPATADAFRQLLDGSASTTRLEKRFVHKDGSIIWADATFTIGRNEAGKPLYVMVAIKDLTAHKRAEAAVQDLKQHLQRNIEMERLRLAQDLHDVPLQQLYGVIYRLEELRVTSDPESAQTISQTIRDIQMTLDALRMVASELRPPSLSRFGLEKAIRSHMHEFREKHPELQTQLILAKDLQALPEDVRLVLFRVLQECTSNIVRHAQATQLKVEFNFDAEEARIEVSDNGKGFVVPTEWLSMVQDGHYGLAGMAERVSAAGGKLEILSQPGVETMVRVVIPCGQT